MTLTLCVLLWSRPGAEQALVVYEDRVLAYLPDHGGQVLQRVRASKSTEGPYEIQVLAFPSTDAFDSYMSDPRRTAWSAQRERAIARTEVIEVDPVDG